jgi:hypothetical protein
MDIYQTCWNIRSAFDYDEDINPFNSKISGIGHPPGLSAFLYDLIVKKVKWLARGKGLTQDQLENKYSPVEDLINEAIHESGVVSFAFGYVMGRMVDIPSPKIQREIEKIKTILREKALLPYLPRERKERRSYDGQKGNRTDKKME